ncbi:hypothetical protein LMTR3_24065 [Bradyrhizobium sp. LMTR 3]|nr:hypothetical protein LMTR3_24065 [Bradyrhizobium sp. LMTR 3]
MRILQPEAAGLRLILPPHVSADIPARAGRPIISFVDEYSTDLLASIFRGVHAIARFQARLFKSR